MNITMKNVAVRTIEEIRNFLTGNKSMNFEINSREDKYILISETLVRLKYRKLRKKDRGMVKSFLAKVTCYEDKQIKRLIQKWKKVGLVYKKRKAVGASVKIYKPADIALLIKTDIAHKTQNGNATLAVLKREYITFGHQKYKTIAGISVSHIYNIRSNNVLYQSSGAIKYSKTIATSACIGERRKPNPEGKPGFLRIDSVHQGDLDGVKGVYHINAVDEVTQLEIVGCVEQITEEFMLPLIEKMLDQFPFVIINFHSDNGSEYINYTIAEILNRLLIKQTKSRSRRTNDNALVETKNGAVIRKHMGRNHIPKENASKINSFYEDHFNNYLNYHRICGFATEYVDGRGKIRKKYDQYMTPYDRLKNIPNAKQFLKPGITFELLDKIAYALSDNEFAEEMQKEKSKLEKLIKNVTFIRK